MPLPYGVLHFSKIVNEFGTAGAGGHSKYILQIFNLQAVWVKILFVSALRLSKLCRQSHGSGGCVDNSFFVRCVIAVG
jgi:hypothetical protein